MTSAVAETSVLGDPANAQGFKTSGGVLVAAGEVIWTAYTTNDTTAPSASALLNLGGRDYLTFRNITFVGGTSNVVTAATQTSTNITFRDCVFLYQPSSAAFSIAAAFGTTLTWLIERCALAGRGNVTGISITADTGTGSDYDLDFTVRNCFLCCPAGALINFTPSGSAAQKPGGIDVYNCTMSSSGYGVYVDTHGSTTYPVNVYNCVILTPGGTGVRASSLGQIVENYCFIQASTTHTNVTQGANTVVNTARAPNWHVGEERLVGAQPRMFMEPKSGSWMLTFGNDGTYTTSEDFLGLPRPGGGASATKGIGYLGRGNTFTKETGTVRTGSNAISITGPGAQDFQLPVDAASTTVSVYVRWDATYAGTKPIMKVLNGGECGVADATDTATGSSGAWEQLSLNFTPARQGIVTIRFQSSDTNGAGQMFVDDFAVA